MGLNPHEFRDRAEVIRINLSELEEYLRRKQSELSRIIDKISALSLEASNADQNNKDSILSERSRLVAMHATITKQIDSVKEKIKENQQRANKTVLDIESSIMTKNKNLQIIQLAEGRYAGPAREAIYKVQKDISVLESTLAVLSDIDGFAVSTTSYSNNGSFVGQYNRNSGQSSSSNSANVTPDGIRHSSQGNASLVATNKNKLNSHMSSQRENDNSETEYKYIADPDGLYVSASGSLSLVSKISRDSKAQRKVGKLAEYFVDGAGNKIHFEGGHLLAALFGGKKGKENLVPMARFINRGPFKQLENSWAKELKKGNNVKVEVIAFMGHNNTSKVPQAIMATYTITTKSGKEITDYFSVNNDDIRKDEYTFTSGDGEDSFAHLDEEQTAILNDILEEDARMNSEYINRANKKGNSSKDKLSSSNGKRISSENLSESSSENTSGNSFYSNRSGSKESNNNK